MFANAKTNIKQQEIEDLVAVSYIFLRNTLKIWNKMYIKEVYFSFGFHWHSSIHVR